MAYENDQNDISLPVGPERSVESVSLLPKYFRTDTNKKFLNSTLDQMIKPGVVEKVNAFAGRRYAKAAKFDDSYLKDVSVNRENYQLEPAVLYKDDLDNVEFFKDYNDYINQIKNFNGSVSNHSILNRQEYYAWNPHINWDKISNFQEYYWLPYGPTVITIPGQSRDVVSTYTVTLSEDLGSVSYVFSPDGLTKSPRLKLYRGQTYRFEINTPGYPFAIAIFRIFLDNDPSLGIDITNESTLYQKGVTSPADYVENGVIEFTVPDDAPDVLYYISQNNVDVSGQFAIFDIADNTEINVDLEIVGKKNYKTSNGIELSNGMKVKFQGNITPKKYEVGNWYVEGVGSEIVLIPESDLEIPAIFTQTIATPYDSDAGFDVLPFEDAISYPADKDYILISRLSRDRNPWSRYNRWFHKDVIETSARVNGLTLNLDQSFRAIRPIIEFEPGLKLFNHGYRNKTNVDLVDDRTEDVFSTVEGSIGYNVDTVDLADGMRVLFTADTDVTVNGKIYQVNFIVHNGVRQISLIEIDDSNPLEGETVLVLKGNKYKGRMFHYTGEEWKLAQDKVSVNQPPLFDLYDKDENSFVDEIVYPSSNFSGNKIFSYKIGSGPVDSELGFALSYRNISNIGDIVFDFNLLTERFEYQNELQETLTKNTDIGFLRKYNTKTEDFVYVNSWKKAFAQSSQAVIRQFVVEKEFGDYPVDVFDNSASLPDLEIKVFVNSKKQKLNLDYRIEISRNIANVVFNKKLNVGDIVLLKCYSSADKNQNGFYEIPINLERNPLNENVTNFTLGEINDHVSSIVENNSNFLGDFPGVGNLRDIGSLTEYGNKFVQHTGPINLSLYHITDKDANIVKAIRFAKKEYAKFKRQFLKEAEMSGFDGTAKEHVDYILEIINKDKVVSQPFYFTDMLGYSNDIKTVHSVISPITQFFALSTPFDLTKLSVQSVNVYLNDVQLIHGRDYIFNEGFVKVLAALYDGDTVTVHEYESTNGSFIPPTPSKLGLFPAYEPQIVVDNTYIEPKTMIQGHDGSLMLSFEDYRDDLILELEKRIYNNIKNNYNRGILDIFEFVGGKYRNTGISTDKINTAMLTDFSQWLENVGSPDFTAIDFWNKDNSFTYNYSSMSDRTQNPISGFWRKIYKDYYDTDRPHSHPWEMLGYSIKPTWWESVYGPAPYTKNNTILWKDLSEGVIREPGKNLIRDSRFVRPDLLDYIPVDEEGNLISPLNSGIAQNFVLIDSKKTFNFGDHAPVETAWRRSSDYPFALLTAWALNQPAKVIGLGFDLSRIEKDLSGGHVYSITGKRITQKDLLFPCVCIVEDLKITSGLINYISNFAANYRITNQVSPIYLKYQNQLTNLTNQLAVKIGGFTDKDKFKLLLDSRTPANKGNVFVPDENYQIFLNTSSPVEVVVFSGVVIERKQEGFIISGYDKENPLFVYNKPITRQNDPVIKVGGISERFVKWDSNNEYPIGTVVEYQNQYYRTKISHRSESSFDANKFSKLAELPVVGGANAVIRKEFETQETVIAYGSILSTIQDVVDFLCGYDNNLKNKGFKFDHFNKQTNALEDMRLCIKEFLFWTTQNWDIGSIISVSPVANRVQFSRSYFTVDDIFDNFYDYNLLTNNGTEFNREFSNIYRSNENEFGVKPVGTSDGIYLVKLPLVQTEHVVLIDNTTVFNDVIFDQVPGYRQERIKVVGYRTDNWTGGLNIPGFFYDTARVTLWQPWTDYTVGDLIKYKEFYYSSNSKHTSTEFFNANNWTILADKPTSKLMPNWDYKTNQFADFYDLDSDNFDLEQQRLAQHLIGYQKRQYLANIIPDEVSQYKFYQGFIQDKGTLNSLTKLFDALTVSNKDSLEFYEEWAIRLGQYGATSSIDEIEYVLDENKFRLEPQIIELNDVETRNRLDLVYEITRSETFLKPTDYDHKPFPTINNYEIFAKDSGFVKEQDVDLVVISEDAILSLDINLIQTGQYIWILDYKNSWTVFRLVADDARVVDFRFYDGGFSLVFDRVIDFRKGDILGINTDLFNLGGYYKIDRVSKNVASFKTDKSLTSFEGFNDSSIYSVTRLVERRFTSIDDVNNKFYKLKQFENEKIWIDANETYGWKHYVNNNIFKFDQQITNPTEDTTFFGKSFDINNQNTLMAVGSPRENDGVVRLYSRSSEKNEWKLLRRLSSIELGSNFGASVAISGDSKHIAIGSPDYANSQGEVYVYTKDIRGYFVQAIRLQGFDTNSKFGNKILFAKTKDKVRLFVSAPEEQKIYVYDYDEENGWTQIPTATISNLDYNTQSLSEEKFDIDETGTILIVSVDDRSEETTAERKVLVYRDNNNVWQLSQEIVSLDKEQDFAYSIALSDNGTKIAIGSPKNDIKGTNNGCVYIYKQINGVFELQQTLFSPFTDFNEMFGIGLDFSQDKLVISSKNGDLRRPLSFDENLTSFDKKTTRFVDKTNDAGKIYLYQELNDYYVYGEDVNKTDFKNTLELVEKVKFKNISNIRVVSNHIYIARPEYDNKTIETVLDCRADLGANSWAISAEQTPIVDFSKIKRCFLYNKEKNKILVDLDIFDPRQGKIPGPADQEITFKTFYDPAVYTFTEAENKSIVVDSENAWTFENVGKLWWKLDTSSWLNAYQGSSLYRSAHWDKLVFNAKVEVCEWVESDISPSEWKRAAGTIAGSTNGISGVPLYDNAYSIRRIYDPLTNNFNQKFYFWVVNKQSLPAILGRRRTAAEVSQLIQDPSQSGYRYISILDNNKFSLHNVRSLIEGTNTVIHFTVENAENQNNIHSEYQLLTEGLSISRPNVQVEEKWIDSLVGYDRNRNSVPDSKLPVRQRYGILNTPRQSMFVNKTEAVKQMVERVNGILIKNQIVDNYDLSKLFEKDEIPDFEKGLYDQSIDNRSQLRFVSTAKVDQAILEPVVVDGKIDKVNIINSGRGYRVSPELVIETSTGSGAVLKANIDNLGKIISVDVKKSGKKYSENDKLLVRKFSVLIVSDNLAENRWSIVEWNKQNQEWNLTASESFDTTKYWNYADWFAPGVTGLSIVDYNIDQSYELFGLNDQIGDIVKINNVGNQGWLLLRKVDNQLIEDYSINYETIGRQNGTIQLSKNLYDYYITSSGFDSNIYDNIGYDKEPIIELRNILTSLKDSIFINELEVEWNKLFFASVRYAFTEQKYLDWIFKTSFVRATHNLGELKQKVTFQNDNLESYEEYVKEAKPFKTKIREYISDYSVNENTQTLTTDFDLPPSYDPVLKNIEVSEAIYTGTGIENIRSRYDEYPFKNWVDNVGFDLVKIEIVDSGEGYLQTPIVNVITENVVEAKAFLSKGKVTSIEIIRSDGKFLTAPKIIIEGTTSEGGRVAKAIAVLGNSLIRTPQISIKFDRYATTEFETDLTVTENFVGTGGRFVFDLKWPAETRKNSYKIYINEELQLTDEIFVKNKKDLNSTYSRRIGYVEFVNAPSSEDLIRVEYTKSINILSAIDRINYYYSPAEGMPGKDYAQLMSGIDYSGVSVTGVGFGTDQGWDVFGWGATGWDTFNNTFDDQIFIVQPDIRIYQTVKPLENNVEYNIYLEYTLVPGETTPESVRIDDPNFDTGTYDNLNAQMNSIVGNGISNIIEIPTSVDLDGVSKIIVRKSTSDGSFSVPDMLFDTFMTGGSFNNNQLVGALGVEAGEIIVDGDGFVTPTTSAGPEELVPGQIVDTLDLQVYHRRSDGSAIIGVASYNIQSDVTEYLLPLVPMSADSIIVKVDNIILPSTAYQIDYTNNLLTIVDVSVLTGTILSTMTFSTNGFGMLETDGFNVTDTTKIVTKILWIDSVSAFVSVNGQVLTVGEDYVLEPSTDIDQIPNRVKITFLNNSVTENDFVQYAIYEGNVQNYSQILIDNTFEANGINNYHVFDGINYPIPFNKQLASFNIFVKVDEKILKPGYSTRFVAGETREYNIETWQFTDLSSVDASEVFVFTDGVELTQEEFTFDKAFSTLRFLRSNVAPEGSVVDLFIITDSDYYFADTKIKFENSIADYINVGDTISLRGEDSVEYNLDVLDVNDTEITVKTFVLDLRTNLSLTSTFILNETTPVTVNTVSFVVSNNLTFKNPPTNGSTVEIYQFSNHDVYDFTRSSYNVITSSNVNVGTPDFYKRNQLRAGIIKLSNPAYSTRYVWIIKNGIMLTPDVDYSLENNTTVKLVQLPADLDNYDVIQINNPPVVPEFGYRMFKDIFNRTHYKRLNQKNSYTLAKDLNYYDIKIDLEDATGIQMPDKTKNMPGIVFVDRERIEFFEVVGNSLTQLRRGTLGTGIKTVHSAGTRAYGQGPEETIPYSDKLTIAQFDVDRSENEIDLGFNFEQELINYSSQSMRDTISVSTEDFVEVVVAGRKLRKTNLDVFVNSDQDSPSGDTVVDPEFEIVENKIIINPELLPETSKVRVEVRRKLGKTWYEDGESLAYSDNAITRFLRSATIELPK
jgi:hypothetical protein